MRRGHAGTPTPSSERLRGAQSCLAAVLLALLVGGCADKVVPSEDGGTSPAASVSAGPLANAKCDAVAGKPAIDQCYVRAALENLEPRYCTSAQGAAERNACFSALANKMGDANLCARVDDARVQGECADSLARSRRSVAPCQAVSAAAVRGHCVRVAAKAAEDPTLCEQIEAADEKDSCYIDLSDKTPDLCSKPQNADRRDQCFIAAGMKNPDYCAKVAAQAQRDNCFRAQANKDMSLCEKVGAGEGAAAAREQCYSIAAGATTSKDEAACAKLPSDAITDKCLTRVAANARDPNLCTKLKLPDSKDTCFADFATPTEPATCLRVVNAAKKKSCAQRNYMFGKEAQLCPLLDAEDKKRCLKAVADAASKKH